ncbi:hypothetical protein [Streptomyces sp. V1I1]|uniref:hypothetical protein n=1 Tax=Streptomyces sp. V1I1 TaxID=3042272 RepID=UPI0027856A92|nr:hypothetical protein [Streptomyces sp. V1I1]MDQ0943320.1 hypothetical protein [Streptomyces sp. V1I1]
MTNSPTPAERLALKTAHAALESRDASYDLVSTVVFALGSAGLLMDPETAEELRRLRGLPARVAALETLRDAVLALHPKYEDSQHCRRDGELWPCSTVTAVGGPAVQAVLVEALHASSGAVIDTSRAEDVRPQVQKLRELIGRQSEDRHESPLHHDYRLPRDFPEAYHPFGEPVAHLVIDLTTDDPEARP